jgi:methionyl-tRNA formyltransferase
MKYSIAIAGTTKRTQQCAQALLESDLFQISWVLTPSPKLVGRKQILTSNHMSLFADSNKISTVFIDKKIDDTVKINVAKLPQPDFLLVVDFGYIIPDWLLKVSKIAPLNIHPSELPKWRGSSPGQFSLLFNEKKSAVTLMVMDNKLDHGPIIHQDFFDVNLKWNQEDYYKHAFNLICTGLDTKIFQFAKKYTNSKTKFEATQDQSEDSPTITASIIKKDQAFVPWEHVQMAMKGLCPTDLSDLSELLQAAYKNNGQFALTLERATKAFNPWPHLWTKIKTPQGEKRMKIIEAEVENLSFDNNSDGDASIINNIEKKLVLKTVQIEGKKPVCWDDLQKK